MEQTREDIIDLLYQVKALERKAECRAVNSSILEKLDSIGKQLEKLDYDLTGIIGD